MKKAGIIMPVYNNKTRKMYSFNFPNCSKEQNEYLFQKDGSPADSPRTRGFVTVATGQERYFNLAYNLMYSYHQFASVKYPFAIICDKENKYTAEFDDVILMENPHCNYLDKLSLYEYLPYDETIFIDADSLAYGNLDEWWNIFKDADDFSVFGYAWTNLNSGRG